MRVQKCWRILVLWIAALISAVPVARAQPPAATDLTVYLLTMGQGDQVWEKFGHNAIWIHDPVAGTDRVYNYGLFDFNSPGYWTRFLRGDWLYQLGEDDIDRTLYQYAYLDRSVTAQELNLAPSQERELQAFLEWNVRPENREYNYDYYRDNCSTRVRDVLDRVLGGRIRAATAGVAAGTTYRWQSERLIAEDRAAFVGLAAGLGPAADRPLSVWQEMFIPMLLQQHLREIRVPDGAGGAVPLVRSERVLVPTTRAPERTAPPRWLVWFLATGVAFGAVLLLLARFSARHRAARFAFAVLGGLWALIGGTAGMLLIGLLFTNHSIAYHNENLLQLSPLLLPLVVVLPALAFGARWAVPPAIWLSFGAAASSALGWALQLLPALDQANGNVIAFALPLNLALAAAVLLLKRNRIDAAPAVAAPARRSRGRARVR